MVRETRLSVDDFVYPLFVVPGSGVEKPIELAARAVQLLGRQGGRRGGARGRSRHPGACILFGIPERKDAVGSEAWKETGIVQKAIRVDQEGAARARRAWPTRASASTPITATAACSTRASSTTTRRSRTSRARSCSYAKAGVDVVAPSGHARWLRRRVPREPRRGRLRSGRDHGVLGEVRVGVLRAVPRGGRLRAAVAAIAAATRWTPANVAEAVREASMDVAEGADIVMVKPALAYLDVIRAVSRRDQHADRRVQRQRRVRDDRGGRREGLDRQATGS